MPNFPGALISTDRGIRRLLPEEFYRGLGGDKDDEVPSTAMLERTSSVFIWEALATSLAKCEATATPNNQATPTPHSPSNVNPSPKEQPDDSFHWHPPDLSEGSPWYLDRVKSLQWAAGSFDDPDAVIQEGLKILDIHRRNYDADGPRPTWLQIVWWEFPEEHWRSLRAGSRMNFLEFPEGILHDNAKMDAEQLAVAEEFCDELISLGILRPGTVNTNGPLFVVPKEGQPGQWRIISDMLRGGQNSCIGSDPVYLPVSYTHLTLPTKRIV